MGQNFKFYDRGIDIGTLLKLNRDMPVEEFDKRVLRLYVWLSKLQRGRDYDWSISKAAFSWRDVDEYRSIPNTLFLNGEDSYLYVKLLF